MTKGRHARQHLHLVGERQARLIEVGRLAAAALVDRHGGSVLAGVAPGGVGGKQEDQQQARTDAGQEQAAERLFGGDREQDHGDGRRQQNAESAAGGDDAGGEARRVAAPAHLRDAGAADRRAGRRARSGHRREEGAGEDVGDAQAAGDPVHPGMNCRIEVGAGARFADRRALQNEQRNRQQSNVGDLLVDVLGDGIERCGGHEQGHEDDGDPAQREGDRHAGKHNEQGADAVENAEGGDAHRRLFSPQKCTRICNRICKDSSVMPTVIRL